MTFSSLGTAVLSIGVGSLFAVPAAAAPAAPTGSDSPVPIKVTINTANGTGCDADDVEVVTYPGGTVAVNLPRLTARAGEHGSGTRIARTNCVANLAVAVPDGYTWSLDLVGARGYAELAERTRGQAAVTAHLAGSSETSEIKTDLTGPYDDRWVAFDRPDLPLAQACGESRALNLNAAVTAFITGGDPKEAGATVSLHGRGGDDLLLAFSARSCGDDDGDGGETRNPLPATDTTHAPLQ